MQNAAVAAADQTARSWTFPAGGALPPGKDAHKEMFARMLLETFNPYKPAVIAWPALDDEARARLVNLPIWDIAVQTEGRARLRMLSYARTVADPLVRQALELNGWEEGRHKEVLARLIAFYGIQLEPEPEYVEPKDPEWSYLVTGFGECIDSFFAFGLFETARRSGFFPSELVETFEPVIQEETRHILFFVNWLAWHKRGMKLWRRPYFFFRVLAVWALLIGERMNIAKDVSSGETGSKQDANFTLTGANQVGYEINTAELLDICLAENDRRLAGYDKRLLRPTTMPRLVRFARFFMRWRRK
ncbi:MAG TPA: ferritin-like domain-containing protein [Acetobacteraceae bacterium]|nr:ferritin-like domain-containing protein [Acetobacteraceae bacterium]